MVVGGFMRNCKIKHLLLLSSALGAGVGGITGLYSPARASCTSYAPATGTTVTCSGTSNTAVSAATGATNVTVNFEDGAQHQVTGTVAVNVRDQSDVNLHGFAAISSSSVGIRILGSGYANTQSVVTLNDNSTVTATGTVSAINVSGSYNQVWLNDSSSLLNSGTGDGIFVTGGLEYGRNTIVIGSGASVTTMGSTANAVDISFGNNDSVINYGILTSVGITVDGSPAADLVINYGTIQTTGGTAISLFGGDDSLTLGSGSLIIGTIDGGDGTDDLTLVGSGSEDSNISNFETLTMNGSEWTLSGVNSFTTIALNSGSLTNNGTLAATGGMNFSAAGARFVNNNTFTGSVSGSTGTDTISNYGTIDGSIALGEGEDSVTLGTGSLITGAIDGGERCNIGA
jgi:hypothetical protein